MIAVGRLELNKARPFMAKPFMATFDAAQKFYRFESSNAAIKKAVAKQSQNRAPFL